MPPAREPTDRLVLAPGARIGGKFRLARRVAKGGMGDVWIAVNEATEARIALKVLRAGREGREMTEARFRREAKLGGLLAHRSIVRIFDLLEEPDGTLVLVMELLRGETLEQRIDKAGLLSNRAAVAVLAPILSALQHGHDLGVIHRDVKPANIFLAAEPDGREIPKLLDFGIAKMPDSGKKTIDGTLLGTPSYMSPEQINGEELDGRSDLFSLGVVLFEACTGVSPFEGKAPFASVAAVLTQEVDPDPRIEPKLWLEVKRAIQKRPSERHSSAAEMAKALYDALGATEESLASELKRSAPSSVDLGEVASEESGERNHAPTVEGQSFGIPRRRAPAWAGWAALAIGVFALGIAALSMGGARPDTHAVVAPPAPVSVAPAASIAVTTPDIAVDPAPSVSQAPAPKPKAPAPARRPPRKKPIATTPGF